MRLFGQFQGEVRLGPGPRKHERDPPDPYHNAYHNWYHNQPEIYGPL
jgi:hypothetical protein